MASQFDHGSGLRLSLDEPAPARSIRMSSRSSVRPWTGRCRHRIHRPRSGTLATFPVSSTCSLRIRGDRTADSAALRSDEEVSHARGQRPGFGSTGMIGRSCHSTRITAPPGPIFPSVVRPGSMADTQCGRRRERGETVAREHAAVSVMRWPRRRRGASLGGELYRSVLFQAACMTVTSKSACNDGMNALVRRRYPQVGSPNANAHPGIWRW